MIWDSFGLGSLRGAVHLSPHDERWHSAYLFLALNLKTKMPFPRSWQMDHVGSTAICHVPARPILDVVIGYDKEVHWEEFRDELLKLSFGFVHRGKNNFGGDFFVAYGPWRLKSYVYLQGFKRGDPMLEIIKSVRNFLDKDPKKAKAYGVGKTSMTDRNFSPSDYRAGKKFLLENLAYS